MLRRILLVFIWLSFIVYAFFFTPPNPSDTLTLIQNLSTGKWADINPFIVALFNLMGIWPLIYSGVLYADGREQNIAAWPFAVGTFFLGAFFLLPYLILRQPAPSFQGNPSRLIRLFDSRWLGVFIFLGTLFFLGYGLFNGDFLDFLEQWQLSGFINVMSLDFCLLCLLFPILLQDDLARRNLKKPIWFWGISGLPLLGAALYLVLRPSLPSFSETDSSNQS